MDAREGRAAIRQECELHGPVLDLTARSEVAAIRFEVAGVVDGRPAISAEHVTRMRPQSAPEWPQPPPHTTSVHRVQIEGVPCLSLDLVLSGRDGNVNEGGVTATAMRIVNAIPSVCGAAPGIVSPRDLPFDPRRRLMER